MSNIQKSWFFSTAPPTFAPFCPFLGKRAFFQKSDNIILNVLWYSIFMQKNIKNSWMVQKIVIWKIEWFFKYCPNLHPFLGMKEWTYRKMVNINLKVHFKSYWNMKSDFQNPWQLCRITEFTKCHRGYLPIFGPFFPLFWKNENFAGKWRLGQFIPFNTLLTLCKPILSNIQKVDFFQLPRPRLLHFSLFGENGHFSRKVTASS